MQCNGSVAKSKEEMNPRLNKCNKVGSKTTMFDQFLGPHESTTVIQADDTVSDVDKSPRLMELAASSDAT
jgi:hypothetical protein